MNARKLHKGKQRHAIARTSEAAQLRELRSELGDALAQQAATSAILKTISRSTFELGPVLEALIENAVRLCAAESGVVYRFDGKVHRLAAAYRVSQQLREFVEHHPIPADRGTAVGRAALERRTVHIPDIAADPDYRYPASYTLGTIRSILGVPMFREGVPVGVMTIWRNEVRPFTAGQIDRLTAFSDQAAIAIENARLFNETREALDQQKASAEVLQVISSSVADAEPVFDKILESCQRLFEGRHVWINLVGDDGAVHLAAYKGAHREAFDSVYPLPLTRESGSGTAILERRVAHYPDVENGSEVPLHTRRGCQPIGVKSVLIAPMLFEARGIGAIFVGRANAGEFSEKEIRLLKTFADQAVIAIENARLFNELERRNRALAEALDQQTATSEILRVISRSPTDVQPVFDAIAHAALALCRAVSANVLTFDGELLHLGARASAVPDTGLVLKVFPRPASTDTVAGRAVLTRRVTVIPDVANDPDYTAPARHLAELTGARSFLGVPLMRDGVPIGALGVGRPEAGNIPEQQIALLQIFADQAVIAIQNARLFHEIAEKSHQLEIANQHKSAFLANMSHELRTPLHAVIGFSQMLAARYFGSLTEKQAEYVQDIIASGKHLLSLINDILDLSKIEAGRMELELGEFDLPATLANALTLVSERARRGEVALRLEVDPALRTLQADERKLKQVLLNLLSNAVKFTPRGGEVRLKAHGADGCTRIAVSDTGVGIAKEDQALIFEAFRQVGTSSTHKREGTGLGLALARRFVELHGGSISVESAPGAGSTFTIQLPRRHGQ